MRASSFRLPAAGWLLFWVCALAHPAPAQTHLLVVSGIGGEPAYSERFHQWGTSLVDAARERAGLTAEQVVYLAERPERDPARIAGRSTRDNVQSALRQLAERAGEGSAVLVVLLGHGTADDQGARINLPGPDLSAAELARALEPLAGRRVVVVNAASASGDFHEPLAAPGRTIITATRSGLERNETMFGQFFVAALAGEGADTDKDGRTSVLEAFQFAQREVERAYQSDGRLQSEHARLSGDPEALRAVFLAPGMTLPPDAPPELRALLAERQRLEGEVETLKTRKEQMEPALYQQQLEALLVQLALKDREIRERGGGR